MGWQQSYLSLLQHRKADVLLYEFSIHYLYANVRKVNEEQDEGKLMEAVVKGSTHVLQERRKGEPFEVLPRG